MIAPYDCKLTTLSSEQRKDLAEKISKQAAVLFQTNEIVSVCGEEYDGLLRQAGVPFRSESEFALPIGKKLKALTAATDPQKSEPLLDATYKIVRRLAKKQHLQRLKDLVEGDMPESGVYLFLDEHEQRLKDLDQLRIVRVGTHGVAAGSKASLRNRMRTHFGTAAGEGNHRSSIFRLHAGRSLINARLVTAIDSLGCAKR